MEQFKCDTVDEKCARVFCDAIRTFTENPENIENLESYLSSNFTKWMKVWANSPEGIASELHTFANMI